MVRTRVLRLDAEAALCTEGAPLHMAPEACKHKTERLLTQGGWPRLGVTDDEHAD